MTSPAVLSRDNILFVFIDLQEKLLATISRSKEVVSGATMLLDAGKILGIPAVVTTQYKKGLGPLAPEIHEHWTGDVPDKTTFSCGADEGIRNQIAQKGRKWVAVAGIETHICVLQTVLDLIRDGRSVVVIADLVASRRERDHEIGLQRMEKAGALIVTREMLVYELLRESGTPEFKQVLQLIKQ